ncbi:MAG: class I SAM-dependent methyltransferase [Bacteroidota bacterium]
MHLNKYDNIQQCGYCKEEDSIFQYNTSDIRGNHYAIHRCSLCKAWFLAPRPNAEQLALAYDDSYYGEKEEKFKTPYIEQVLDLFRMGRSRRLAARIHQEAHILDIGCGNGKFLAYMNKMGSYHIYGVELEGNSALRASRVPGIQLKTGRLEAGDFETSSLDAITMFHVFEHLEEPKETLNMITQMLKPGGILMMSFPNINSFQARFFKGKWLHLDPPRHLFFFRHEDLLRIMSEFGYECKRTKYFSLEQNPFGMAQSLLNCLLKKREVLFEHLKGNNSYAPEYGSFNLLLQKAFFILGAPFFILGDIVMSSLKKSATVEYIFQKRD